MKYILYVIVFVISLTIAFLSVNTVVIGTATGVASAIIFLFIGFIINNIKWFKYLYWTIRYFDTSIRLSISYLYRIKLNDEYFLIKGERIKNQYQPVGGVYKRYKSAEKFFKEINALDDDLFPIDKSSKDDLRIRIKGRYLLNFIKWFDSKSERETCQWREFYEELIQTNIINQKDFPYIFTNFIKQYVYGIKWSEYSQSKELLIAEIYEPIFNDEQTLIFESLKCKENEKYCFMSENQINRLGVIPKEEIKIQIAKTAKWLI